MFATSNAGGVAVALAVCMAGWFLMDTAAATKTEPPGDVPAAAYEHPETLVSLPGGRRLNLFCMGSGEPVVILEAGGGENSLTFRRVQGRLSAVTRVCSYDRAGMGFSDPSDGPNTAAHVVSDLHTLIARAAIPRPVILVGHSNGGLYGRLYASEFPDDVAGMVMIDPNSVGLDRDAESVLDRRQLKAWRASNQVDIDQARRCVALARTGALAKTPAAYPQCMDDPPNADPALHRVLNDQLSRLSQQKALLSETLDTYPKADGGLPNAEQAVERAHFDFLDKPFIVMSGTDEQGGLPAALRKRVIKAILANQSALVAHSTQGRQIFVNVRSEDIQLSQPGMVVRAVSDVIATARARAGLKKGYDAPL